MNTYCANAYRNQPYVMRKFAPNITLNLNLSRRKKITQGFDNFFKIKQWLQSLVIKVKVEQTEGPVTFWPITEKLVHIAFTKPKVELSSLKLFIWMCSHKLCHQPVMG